MNNTWCCSDNFEGIIFDSPTQYCRRIIWEWQNYVHTPLRQMPYTGLSVAIIEPLQGTHTRHFRVSFDDFHNSRQFNSKLTLPGETVFFCCVMHLLPHASRCSRLTLAGKLKQNIHLILKTKCVMNIIVQELYQIPPSTNVEGSWHDSVRSASLKHVGMNDNVVNGI